VDPIKGVGIGIAVQDDKVPSTFSIDSSAIMGATAFGIQVVSSDARVSATLVRDTNANDVELYGDGIAVLTYTTPAAVEIATSRIEKSARAAVSVFGASATLSGTELACQKFDIDGEASANNVFQVQDLGGNGCGCPDAARSCTLVSSGLTPPTPLAQ